MPIPWAFTYVVKFVFSKKVTKIDEIFTVDLTLTAECQIDGEDFVNFCCLLREHELYYKKYWQCSKYVLST